MNIKLIHTADKTFQWKDRKDNLHAPANMQTRHLFMTLVMIWNHTMPIDACIARSGNWEHHKYNLGPYYTGDYLSTAIGSLFRELVKRTDMEPAWKVTLLKMHEYLRDNCQVKDIIS